MIVDIYGCSSRDEEKSSRFKCYESVQEIFCFPFTFSKNNTSIMINATDTPISVSGIKE